MIVCSFHTGGPYARESERLRASLDRLGLAYRIDELPSLGSWDANITLKPAYIRRVMDEYDGPVLYVDADAEFHDVPDIRSDADIAVHYLRGHELLGGTIWLSNTERSKSLVDLWAARSRVGEWDQVTLQKIAGAFAVERLGPEYCYIFDTSRRLHPHVTPIIEHHQASRRLKHEVLNAAEPAGSHR